MYYENVDIFSDNIINSIDAAPFISIAKSPGKKTSKMSEPWWNDECTYAITCRKHLKARDRRTRLYDDILLFKNQSRSTVSQYDRQEGLLAAILLLFNWKL